MIQLVRELPIVGGDVRKVGYYTGIIVRTPNLLLWDVALNSILTGVSESCGGGDGSVALEPAFRLCRAQACSSIVPRGHNNLDHLVWPLPFSLGNHFEVPACRLPRVPITDLMIAVAACMVR
jgi:hypothetical protein